MLKLIILNDNENIKYITDLVNPPYIKRWITYRVCQGLTWTNLPKSELHTM